MRTRHTGARFAIKRTRASERARRQTGLRSRALRKRRRSRVSQCFNLSSSDFRLHKGPRASLRRSRGWRLSPRARSMGEFSLWFRERAATMVIYLMRKGLVGTRTGGRGRRRGDGRVKERARIVSARTWGVRESVSKNNGPQRPRAPPPPRPDENVTQ